MRVLLDHIKGVQHIGLGHDKLSYTVEHQAVFQRYQVQPTAAARPAGGGAGVAGSRPAPVRAGLGAVPRGEGDDRGAPLRPRLPRVASAALGSRSYLDTKLQS